MLGLGEAILALLGLAFVVAFLVALVLGVWKIVHKFKRQARLEREEDERRLSKQLATDYADSVKALEDLGISGAAMSFNDYNHQRLSNKVPAYPKGGIVK